MSKYFLFNETHHGLTIIFPRFALQDGAVWIGEWNVRHAWHERIEPTVIMRLACSESDRAHGPPVKPSQETDEVMSLGVILRQFDCCLNGFRSGVCQKCFCALFKRRDLIQLFAQADPAFVIKIGGDVQEFFSRSLNSFHDSWVGVSC